MMLGLRHRAKSLLNLWHALVSTWNTQHAGAQNVNWNVTTLLKSELRQSRMDSNRISHVYDQLCGHNTKSNFSTQHRVSNKLPKLSSDEVADLFPLSSPWKETELS